MELLRVLGVGGYSLKLPAGYIAIPVVPGRVNLSRTSGMRMWNNHLVAHETSSIQSLDVSSTRQRQHVSTCLLSPIERYLRKGLRCYPQAPVWQWKPEGQWVFPGALTRALHRGVYWLLDELQSSLHDARAIWHSDKVWMYCAPGCVLKIISCGIKAEFAISQYLLTWLDMLYFSHHLRTYQIIVNSPVEYQN